MPLRNGVTAAAGTEPAAAVIRELACAQESRCSLLHVHSVAACFAIDAKCAFMAAETWLFCAVCEHAKSIDAETRLVSRCDYSKASAVTTAKPHVESKSCRIAAL